MRNTILFLALLLSTSPVWANRLPDNTSTPTAQGPYVTLNVGLELNTLERAAQDTAQATKELASAVRSVAASPSLSEEQKAQLMTVVSRVDSLSGRVAAAMDRMPAAVRETREPLTALGNKLAFELRLTLVGVIALLLILIVGILWGLYAFVLRPGRALITGITSGIGSMARSLERSAELVAEANKIQLELAKALNALEALRAAQAKGTVAPNP